MPVNWKQLYAIQKKNEEIISQLCPEIDDDPGIYFFYRISEQQEKEIYVGQARHLRKRCGQHLSGYQYIDLSIRAHKLWSNENEHGYKLAFRKCPVENLDEEEQRWIKYFSEKGWILKNKTAGGQGEGKTKIGEYKPSKGYRQGVDAGYRKASKEVSHLFDLHLDVKTKSDKPNKNQEKALQKFNDFLEYHKRGEDE